MQNLVKSELNKIIIREEEYSGPQIYYSRRLIKYVLDEIRNHAGDTLVLYSVKANTNKRIIEYMSGYVDGVEIASWDEYVKVKNILNKIHCIEANGLAFSKEQIKKLIQENVLFDFLSITQIKSVINSLKGKEIGIRINISQSNYGGGNRPSRFGICFINEADVLKRLCEKNNISIVRVHLHTGEKNEQEIIKICMELKKWISFFPSVKSINLGGGWDYLYFNHKIGTTLLQIKSMYPGKKISIEPGSLLVRNAGFLMAQVIDYKNIRNRAELVLDASAFNLSSWYKAKVIGQVVKNDKNALKECDIYGNTCYEDDFFVKGIKSNLKNGDIAYLYPVGAYFRTTARCLHDIGFPKEVII